MSVLVAGASGVPTANAQAVPPGTNPIATAAIPTISVVSVSPWVAEDGEWNAQFIVKDAPSGATISYNIRQPLSGTEPEVRDALRGLRAGTPANRVLIRSDPVSLASITNPSGVTVLTIPVRSRAGDPDRIFLPNRGAHPVVVNIGTANGDSVVQQVLSLNRLPAAAKPRSASFKLAFLLSDDNSGGFDAAGSPAVSPESVARVQEITRLLAAAPTIPFTSDIDPETIEAMGRSDRPTDRTAITALHDALGKRSVLRRPWSDLHTEGWARTGDTGTVRSILDDGQRTLFGRLFVPIESRVWPTDLTVGTSGVKLLSDVGVASMIVEPMQSTGPKFPASESGFSRPFRVRGTGTTALNAFSLDPDLQSLVEDPSGEAALASHQIITQMFATWLADDAERGAVLRVDAASNPTTVSALIDTLTAGMIPGQPHRAVEAVDALTLTQSLPLITARLRNVDTAVVRELVEPSQIPDLRATAALVRTVRPIVDDFAAIMPADAPTSARLSIQVRQSTGSSLAPAQQVRSLRAIGKEARNSLDKVTAPESRSLTVTARQTSIPLRFNNGLDSPVTARLRVASPRLRFLDGTEREVTLVPGANRLEIPVEVRSSGEFVLRTQLLVPNSGRILTTTNYRVRSTAFSGVGLMLSGGALLFLVFWWSRTIRRRNESRPEPDSTTDAGE